MQSLKEFREHGSRHYQVKSIAQAIGVTEPTYRALEQNQAKRITPEIAEKLGSYFGCDADIFLTKKPK